MVQNAAQKISVAIPRMPDADMVLPYLRRIDAARYYSNFGPLVREFEARIGAGYGVEPACVSSVASGTAALTLALRASAPTPGSLCMMPSWTFSATAHAAREAGLTPYFVDVARDSWALTPEIADAEMRHAPGEVGVVLPVAPFGAPIGYDRWDEFSAATGVPVVIDAAAAFDTAQPGRAPVVISLHATKVLGVGEGGLLISRDADLVAKVRSLSNFGFQHSRVAALPGINAKLSEYAAAVGLAALDAWPFVRTGYVRLAQTYAAALSAIPELSVLPGFGQGWAGTTCLVELADPVTSAVARDLTRAGIESRQWWGRGCHQQAAFAYYPSSSLAVTRYLANHTLLLPFHLGLGPAELNRIVSVVADSLAASATAPLSQPRHQNDAAQAG